MKKCKQCGATPSEADFYASINAYCKKHWREKVAANRAKNIDKVRQYDKDRAKLPHRIDAAKKIWERWRASNPERRAAQVALGNAVRAGKVTPLPCLMCGQTAEAHHPDYSQPLSVVWLCPAHHKQTHAMARQGGA